MKADSISGQDFSFGHVGKEHRHGGSKDLTALATSRKDCRPGTLIDRGTSQESRYGRFSSKRWDAISPEIRIELSSSGR
jgi:hypothetical protein